MSRNYEDDRLIEEAIKFLVASIEKSGKNPKPVILHSIRMAMYLNKLGYSHEIIVGALLHDLLEDSAVTLNEIKKRFRNEVAALVEANSFDESISDKATQYKDLFERCKKAGKDALLVKAADILDNSDYYNGDEQLLEKMRYFIEFSKSDLMDERAWQDLERKYKRIKPA